MYNLKEFKELEAKALNDRLFIDTQIVTATPGFYVAACTVSDRDGKRVYRAVEGKYVAEVIECAITVVLCAYYDKPIPAVFSTVIPTEDQVKNPPVETGKQSPSTIKLPVVGGKATAGKSEDKAEDKAAKTVEKDNATAGTTVPTAPAAGTTAPAASTTVPAADPTAPAAGTTTATASTTASADSAGTAQDDFRVLVGNYARRDDNFITQLLSNEEGRKFLKSAVNIQVPSAKIKACVEQTKAYLMAHNIQL